MSSKLRQPPVSAVSAVRFNTLKGELSKPIIIAPYAALPEVPCTATAVFGLLQQASTVLNFGDDVWTCAQISVYILWRRSVPLVC